MPKKIDALPIEGDTLSQERLDQAGAAAQELNALQVIANDNARAVALQVGYEGSMTVGALEDEIRFYQRQTVQAILETGKRLMILKELTPRGEFDSRVELLGISRRTAYRFMQVAVKTGNRANLAQIGSQVKNASAFLELITHDDDVIEALSEMDEFDRMSGTELRNAAREIKAEHAVRVKMVADRDATIAKLEGKAQKPKTDEELLQHRALGLYALIAEGATYAKRLSNEISSLLDESDPLLKQEAENALALVAQHVLRVGDMNYIPLDLEAIGLDLTDFEGKALGLNDKAA